MILPGATMVQVRSVRRALLVFLLLCLPVSLTAGIGGGYDTGDGAPRLTATRAPAQVPASPRAIARVADESTPARLRAYRGAVERMDRLVGLRALAERHLARLEAMPGPDRHVAYPGGGYDTALAAAQASNAELSRKVKRAEAARLASLHILTGGRPLSAGDLAALHRMLGL